MKYRIIADWRPYENGLSGGVVIYRLQKRFLYLFWVNLEWSYTKRRVEETLKQLTVTQ